MPNKKTNPKFWPTKGLLTLRRRQRVYLRQPHEEQHCPARPPKAQEAAKAGPAPSPCEQVPAAGAQSRVPAPHSPCCTPGPSPTPLAAQTLGREQAGAVLAAPETKEGALAKEQGESGPCRPREPHHEEDHSEQKLRERELNRHPELSQGGDSSDQRSSHESWDRITIHTLWVNPRYAELLQKPHSAPQDGAEPAAPSVSVPAAGSESQLSTLHSSYCSSSCLSSCPSSCPSSCHSSCHSSCCSSCSSALLSAQMFSELQGLQKLQPSSSRQALQTLRRLFWCSCTAAQTED